MKQSMNGTNYILIKKYCLLNRVENMHLSENILNELNAIINRKNEIFKLIDERSHEIVKNIIEVFYDKNREWTWDCGQEEDGEYYFMSDLENQVFPYHIDDVGNMFIIDTNKRILNLRREFPFRWLWTENYIDELINGKKAFVERKEKNLRLIEK